MTYKTWRHCVKTRMAKPGAFPRRTHAAGFTLVEVLMALAIAGVVMGALMSVFVSQQTSCHTQLQAIALQQNMRAAMTMIARDIRMAGYYTALDRKTFSGMVDWDPGTPGSDDFQAAVQGINNVTGVSKYKFGSDIIMIVKAGDEKRVLNSKEYALSGSRQLYLSDLDLDNDSDMDLNMAGKRFGVLVKKTLSCAQLFCITAIAGMDTDDGPISAITVRDPFKTTYSEHDLVFRADIIIYRVDDANTSFSCPVLSRKNVSNGNRFLVVAEYISDLQLSYILTDGREVVDTRDVERQVRCVRVALKGEIDMPGAGKEERELVSIVHIRNMNPG